MLFRSLLAVSLLTCLLALGIAQHATAEPAGEVVIAWRGVGPRIAEHALDTFHLVPSPAHEDIKLKAQSPSREGGFDGAEALELGADAVARRD